MAEQKVSLIEFFSQHKRLIIFQSILCDLPVQSNLAAEPYC